MSTGFTVPRFVPGGGCRSRSAVGEVVIFSISPMPVSFDIGAAPGRQILAPMYCGGLCDAVVEMPPSQGRLPIAK
jgi:hypothetical protein